MTASFKYFHTLKCYALLHLISFLNGRLVIFSLEVCLRFSKRQEGVFLSHSTTLMGAGLPLRDCLAENNDFSLTHKNVRLDLAGWQFGFLPPSRSGFFPLQVPALELCLAFVFVRPNPQKFHHSVRQTKKTDTDKTERKILLLYNGPQYGADWLRKWFIMDQAYKKRMALPGGRVWWSKGPLTFKVKMRSTSTIVICYLFCCNNATRQILSMGCHVVSAKWRNITASVWVKAFQQIWPYVK